MICFFKAKPPCWGFSPLQFEAIDVAPFKKHIDRFNDDQIGKCRSSEIWKCSIPQMIPEAAPKRDFREN